ncbi:hypothetical protein [Bacillus cereus group sp. BfR-BA-01349]|uniref:hypothetical protein n=1 Tax=Bacillus cereus group sp. BfR-BA-01349 TaxID=2920312 RepID=UPI001F5AA7D5
MNSLGNEIKTSDKSIVQAVSTESEIERKAIPQFLKVVKLNLNSKPWLYGFTNNNGLTAKYKVVNTTRNVIHKITDVWSGSKLIGPNREMNHYEFDMYREENYEFVVTVDGKDYVVFEFKGKELPFENGGKRPFRFKNFY